MRRNFLDPSYQRWRKAVLARDGYKCQWPKCRCKRRLQVHHIRKWSTAAALRYTVSNGISLCRVHHNKVKGKEIYYIEVFTTIIRSKK